MRFEVWEERGKPEPVCRLRLITWNGHPTLAAVDERGEVVQSGLIGYIGRDGTFYRHSDASPSIGLQLDLSGRIVVTP